MAFPSEAPRIGLRSLASRNAEALAIGCSLVILLIAAVFVLFYRLDGKPLNVWDEARLAVNAIEMARNGDYIVTHYAGAPDMWNTKPPLLIWLQAFSLKLVAPPVLAVRLPSAIAALATVLLVFAFCLAFLRNTLAGLLSGLVLLSSAGFVGFHSGRSADYDALLVFWITLYALSYFLLLGENGRLRGLFLAGFAAGLTLAVLTKGAAALLPLPGLLAYTFLTGRWRQIFLRADSYVAAVAVLIPCLGYYALREHYNPGYIEAVLANEVTGRFAQVNEAHDESMLFYLKQMVAYRFTPWIFALPICTMGLLWLARGRDLAVASFATCFVAFFMLTIMAARTKLEWYDVPLYPMASLLVGLAVAKAVAFIPEAIGLAGEGRRRTACLLAVLLLFPLPVAASFYAAAFPTRTEPKPGGQLMYGDFIASLREARPKLTNYTIVDGGVPNTAKLPSYNAALRFHVEAANRAGLHLSIAHPGQELHTGQVVASCDLGSIAWLRQKYRFDLIWKKTYFDVDPKLHETPCLLVRIATGQPAPETGAADPGRLSSARGQEYARGLTAPGPRNIVAEATDGPARAGCGPIPGNIVPPAPFSASLIREHPCASR